MHLFSKMLVLSIVVQWFIQSENLLKNQKKKLTLQIKKEQETHLPWEFVLVKDQAKTLLQQECIAAVSDGFGVRGVLAAGYACIA